MKLEGAAEGSRTREHCNLCGPIADPRFSTGYGFGSRGEVVTKWMTSETGGRNNRSPERSKSQ